MQHLLKFPTTTVTTTRHHPLSTLSLPYKPPSFSTTTTTTTTHPLKPSKSAITTTTTTTTKQQQQQSPDFHDKTLFLDSLGFDSLSLLPPSAIAASSSLSDLRSLFHYLSSFEFTSPELRRIILMCPDILSLRLRDVTPVFSFLLREAHVPPSDLRRVISRRPRLLISDVQTRLRPTLYFLQSIGIHEVHKHTNLLSSSVEDKFIPKILYFENLGFSHRDSLSMFSKFPALFCYSVKENFEPKFNYFVVEMGRDLKELKEFPQYFSFSLEKRIKPRHQICVENGVCFPLPVMLKMKEVVFRERLDVCCNSSMPHSSSPLWVCN